MFRLAYCLASTFMLTPCQRANICCVGRRLVLMAIASALLPLLVCNAEETAELKSKKKGFCTITKEGSQWVQKLQALDAKWFYSWGPTKPKNTPPEIEFVPMVWGKYNARRPQLIDSLAAEYKQGKFQYLMGFNEPDASTQSNLSVDEAASLWPELMKPGIPLASPSCVHPDRDWMKDFMKAADERDLRVDYVCVHSYGGPNADALVKRLQDVHEMYGKPIWITEFAVGDWSAKSIAENKHSPKRIAKFMRRVIPKLEKLDFVHRYSWYSAAPDNAALGNSALFDEEGSLTELGQLYSSF